MLTGTLIPGLSGSRSAKFLESSGGGIRLDFADPRPGTPLQSTAVLDREIFILLLPAD